MLLTETEGIALKSCCFEPVCVLFNTSESLERVCLFDFSSLMSPVF